MLRSVATQLARVSRGALVGRVAAPVATSVRHCHPGIPDIYDPGFDERYVQYFNQPDLDGWDLRKGMTDLMQMDLIPDPKITVAVLHACRRLNDYALTTRWLEGCHDKCGGEESIYKWLIAEIKPTLEELGVSTPEELGYGVPELAMKRPHEY